MANYIVSQAGIGKGQKPAVNMEEATEGAAKIKSTATTPLGQFAAKNQVNLASDGESDTSVTSKVSTNKIKKKTKLGMVAKPSD